LILLRDRVSPGVDEAAYVKAGFLTVIAKKEITCPVISAQGAVNLLGMIGSFATSGGESFKGETDVGGNVTVHSQ
jgi:aconitase B